jgi:hypothetical protein
MTEENNEVETTQEDAPSTAEADAPDPREAKAQQAEQELAMQRAVKQQIADHLGVAPMQVLRMDVARDEDSKPVPNICDVTVRLDMNTVPASLPIRVPMVKLARLVAQILGARDEDK